MFPPRSGRPEADEPKVMVNFRAPKSIKDYLGRAKAGGYTETDVILMSVEIVRDLIEAMGPEWWELWKRAQQSSKAAGTVLGELALEALKHPPKRK